MKNFVVRFADLRLDVSMTLKANTEEEAAQLFIDANKHLRGNAPEIHVFVKEEGTDEMFDIGLTRKPKELALSFGFFSSTIAEQLREQFPEKSFDKDELDRLERINCSINHLKVGSYITELAAKKARLRLLKDVKKLVQSN